jgi:hypothetical protein
VHPRYTVYPRGKQGRVQAGGEGSEELFLLCLCVHRRNRVAHHNDTLYVHVCVCVFVCLCERVKVFGAHRPAQVCATNVDTITCSDCQGSVTWGPGELNDALELEFLAFLHTFRHKHHQFLTRLPHLRKCELWWDGGRGWDRRGWGGCWGGGRDTNVLACRACTVCLLPAGPSATTSNSCCLASPLSIMAVSSSACLRSRICVRVYT